MLHASQLSARMELRSAPLLSGIESIFQDGLVSSLTPARQICIIVEMTPDQLRMLVREQEPYIFDRMFRAAEKVRERLERTCQTLNNAGIPYAIVGGNAVAAWVATKDDGAVRNTRDVDILLREKDIARATEAMRAAGFYRETVMGTIVFLDGPDGRPSQGIHVLRAGQKVKESYSSPAPQVEQSVVIDGKPTVLLDQLVEMKLNSFRDQDRTHLRDLIGVGLIDATWPPRFAPLLGERLQCLLDDPDG